MSFSGTVRIEYRKLTTHPLICGVYFAHARNNKFYPICTFFLYSFDARKEIDPYGLN